MVTHCLNSGAASSSLSHGLLLLLIEVSQCLAQLTRARDGITRWEGRRERRRKEGREGISICDGNYGVGEYSMKWVYHEEPERSLVTS